MQTITPRFAQLAGGDVQPVTWRLRISFDKQTTPDIEFFTLDQSQLDGGDLLAPDDSLVVQPWDSYDYKPYDDRVVSMEITHEELQPYSSAKAYADLTLNNYDLLFSPDGGSSIADNVLPQRPFRLFLGFENTALPMFVGLNPNMPEINRTEGTAKFHMVDFLSFLYDQEISQTTILLDKTISEILDSLLQLLGLIPDQYELDGSTTVVPFFYVTKGQKFGEVAEKLMEAELGRLYMNELGIIRFRNRYGYDETPVMEFSTDLSNVNDWKGSNDTQIWNSVRVKANPREVKEYQPIYQSQEQYELNAGQTIEVWFTLEDPVISATAPTYSATEVSNAPYYIASSSGVVLDNMDEFAEALKLTFTNTTGTVQSITDVVVWGEPAKPIYDKPIEVVEIADDSVAKYGNKWYEIENDYIQNEITARNRALTIVNDYKDLNGVVELDVKGNPALQVGDYVDLSIPGYTGVYSISKITNVMDSNPFEYRQRLIVRKRPLVSFFTLDVSQLDGEDVLGL